MVNSALSEKKKLNPLVGFFIKIHVVINLAFGLTGFALTDHGLQRANKNN